MDFDLVYNGTIIESISFPSTVQQAQAYANKRFTRKPTMQVVAVSSKASKEEFDAAIAKSKTAPKGKA